MSIEVTDDLVRHVARLSRLAISDKELAELKEHFRKVLAYIAAFQELDTDAVDPSHFALDACNVYREDESAESLGSDLALGNAPQAHPPYFVVPRIVGDADESAGGSS